MFSLFVWQCFQVDEQANILFSLWGNPGHLRQVARYVRERYDETKLHILVAERNSGSFTYDGIELGGERVCHEIEEEVAKLAEKGQTINKISIFGYSLGGLVARYAIGVLESHGFFEHVQPLVRYLHPHQ